MYLSSNIRTVNITMVAIYKNPTSTKISETVATRVIPPLVICFVLKQKGQ